MTIGNEDFDSAGIHIIDINFCALDVRQSISVILISCFDFTWKQREETYYACSGTF